MFCKIFAAAKTLLDVVTCKIKHFTTFLLPRPSHGKSTALKHFCKCFILHVTSVYLQVVFDHAKNVLQHFSKKVFRSTTAPIFLQ